MELGGEVAFCSDFSWICGTFKNLRQSVEILDAAFEPRLEKYEKGYGLENLLYVAWTLEKASVLILGERGLSQRLGRLSAD